MSRRSAVVLLSLAITVASAPAAGAACRGAKSTPKRTGIAKARAATVCEINRARARHGLGRLRFDRELRSAASSHTRDMALQDFFSHVSADGRSLLDRVTAVGALTGTATRVVGETLGWGLGRAAAPRSIVRNWLSSPAHRALLLDPRYRYVGVGIVRGAPMPVRGSAATYTAVFAS